MKIHITIPQQAGNIEPTKTEMEFAPSPETLAAEFWEMYADDQAKFFNHLGAIIPPGHWPFQCRSIMETNLLTLKGERIIEDLYNDLK